MNAISAPAAIPLKRRRRFGLIVGLAVLVAAVACALAFAVDWNSTESQGNNQTRAGVFESAGSWSGVVDRASGIPLSAGIVGLPAGVLESAGGWSGLVDPATGIPLSVGVVGLPTSAVQARLNPYAR